MPLLYIKDYTRIASSLTVTRGVDCSFIRVIWCSSCNCRRLLSLLPPEESTVQLLLRSIWWDSWLLLFFWALKELESAPVVLWDKHLLWGVLLFSQLDSWRCTLVYYCDKGVGINLRGIYVSLRWRDGGVRIQFIYQSIGAEGLSHIHDARLLSQGWCRRASDKLSVSIIWGTSCKPTHHLLLFTSPLLLSAINCRGLRQCRNTLTMWTHWPSLLIP